MPTPSPTPPSPATPPSATSCPTAGFDWLVGIGSPHGDDAVGWRAVERFTPRRLAEAGAREARVSAVREPLELLHHLAGCFRLWIVDACRGPLAPGAVAVLRWPHVGLVETARASTHALGVCDALRLAEALGTLPPSVAIIAVGVDDPTVDSPTAHANPPADLSAGTSRLARGGLAPAVEAALPVIEQVVLAESRRAADGARPFQAVEARESGSVERS